jgi:hypothetical protein
VMRRVEVTAEWRTIHLNFPESSRGAGQRQVDARESS